ncbi:ABC transporter ATP-binding protein [Paenibacillus flagellatus]|uniref:Bacitracin ABC transporter ATP-binding protein n=1 Tax=Paenibacillus flagellatus TaxID=2211139 RepID=A0A2V5KLA0_9BACL|nr:ABC transporter ATP-binding protein [Paenibacillus flagellatus]PYI55750.1 bacitracin ABC transporter ATP-binding protein [Paenibacillus flagellatus]
MPVLETNALTKIYEGTVSCTALDNVSLTIGEGEFVGIMGPSGSGKTTLLNVIATIDEPTAGEIVLDGRSPFALDKREKALFRRRRLGFVFQHYNLLEKLTVEENVALPLVLDRVPVHEIETRLEETMRTLGIGHLRAKRTYELSGGQMQRTAIARAIIHRPALVLADEPTGNLDSRASNDVMTTLSALGGRDGATILMATHDASAASYCDRVVFIKDGKLVNDMYRGDSRQTFFQRILDMLSLLGGDSRDVTPARL